MIQVLPVLTMPTRQEREQERAAKRLAKEMAIEAVADAKSQRDEDRVRSQKLRSEELAEYTWEDGTVEVMPLKRQQ